MLYYEMVFNSLMYHYSSKITVAFSSKLAAFFWKYLCYFFVLISSWFNFKRDFRFHSHSPQLRGNTRATFRLLQVKYNTVYNSSTCAAPCTLLSVLCTQQHGERSPICYTANCWSSNMRLGHSCRASCHAAYSDLQIEQKVESGR